MVEPDEADYAAYLDFTYHADATITFPQTVYMRFALFEKDKGWGEAGQAYAKWFWKRLVKLEQRLENREYLCADRFTVADICCGYALILARKVGLDEGVPATLKAYRERLTAREGYLRAVEREAAGPAAIAPVEQVAGEGAQRIVARTHDDDPVAGASDLRQPIADCAALGNVFGMTTGLLDQRDDPFAALAAVDRAPEIDRIA